MLTIFIIVYRIVSVYNCTFLFLFIADDLSYLYSPRSMFVDKFLLWKVFPVRCLRWILQFAVLECPPITNLQKKGHETNNGLLDTTQRLAAVWSKQDFVQSAPVEQQACILSTSTCLIESSQLG